MAIRLLLPQKSNKLVMLVTAGFASLAISNLILIIAWLCSSGIEVCLLFSCIAGFCNVIICC